MSLKTTAPGIQEAGGRLFQRSSLQLDLPTHYQLQSHYTQVATAVNNAVTKNWPQSSLQLSAAGRKHSTQGRACCLHWILCICKHSTDVHHECSVITAMLFSVTQHTVQPLRPAWYGCKKSFIPSLNRRWKSVRVHGKVCAQRMFIVPSIVTPVKTCLNSKGQMT